MWSNDRFSIMSTKMCSICSSAPAIVPIPPCQTNRANPNFGTMTVSITASVMGAATEFIRFARRAWFSALLAIVALLMTSLAAPRADVLPDGLGRAAPRLGQRKMDAESVRDGKRGRPLRAPSRGVSVDYDGERGEPRHRRAAGHDQHPGR